MLTSPGDAASHSGRGGASSSSSTTTSLHRRRLISRPMPSRRRRRRALCRHRRLTAAAASSSSSFSSSSRVCDLYDVSDTLTPYATAWEWQKKLLDARLEALSVDCEDDDDNDDDRLGVRDCLLLVQHPPVVTLGTGSTPDNLKFDPDSPKNAPFPVHRTERGGEATYHGPGQLVLYPIINLQVRVSRGEKRGFFFLFSFFFSFAGV